MPPVTPAIGTDLVHIPSFAEQLRQPGSRFHRVFSAFERRHANQKLDPDQHLAGRWAAKEAFVKAWSQALYGTPPVIDLEDFDWSQVEVVPDQWGRVAIHLIGEVAEQVAATMGGATPHISLSISHDGDYATATCCIALMVG